jgi:hypothetical protein
MPISLLFSGHMVDLPDRKEPRFPASLEKAVEKRIASAISPYIKFDSVAGFASAARGADIIFHEQCRAVGIPTTVIIPFSPEKFVAESIAGMPDRSWEARFWKLWEETDADKRDAMMMAVSPSAYRACNVRLVYRASMEGDLHLIAFWDGKCGDGTGGTSNLIEVAQGVVASEIFGPEELSGV